MKNLMILFVLALVPFMAIGQDSTATEVATEEAPIEEVTPLNPSQEIVTIPSGGTEYTLEQLIDWSVPIGAGAMALLTFLTGLFPNFTLFKDDKKRDLAAKALTIAVIVGIVFIGAGFADGWQVALSFLLSTLGYDKILRPMGIQTKTSAGTEPRAIQTKVTT